jgi:hypothetical protein
MDTVVQQQAIAAGGFSSPTIACSQQNANYQAAMTSWAASDAIKPDSTIESTAATIFGINALGKAAGAALDWASRLFSSQTSAATSAALQSESTAAFSVYDTSGTAAGSRYLKVTTNVSSADAQSTLTSNGFNITSQGVNANGGFTVYINGSSTYTFYTRTSTGEFGAQFFGQNGATLKISFPF